MTAAPAPPDDLDRRISARLLEVLIRAGVIAALVVLCYQVFQPFLTLMVWSLILAVAMYPMHRWLSKKLGGRQGWTSTVIVLACVLVIIIPAAFLMNSFGDSVRGLIDGVQNNTLEIPPPKESVKKWPAVGEKVFGYWTQAHDDLPGLVRSLQPKIGEIARRALSTVASIGLALLMFVAAIIIAGIIMAHGEAGARTTLAIFTRLGGPERGEKFTKLATASIRTVAQGVLGVAFIQAVIIGVSLLIAGVPWAGVLAGISLVLAIAQVPTLIVTLPAIAYLWMGHHHGPVASTIYTVILLLAGLIDNVLKPLLLGRGVDAPMPVILLGALGGMAADGILGMFVGATLLALGYQVFMGWVATPPPPEGNAGAAPSS